MDMTIGDGVRCDTNTAYIDPISSRENLSVFTGAKAVRILFEGKKAVGIEYIKNGEKTVVCWILYFELLSHLCFRFLRLEKLFSVEVL